MFFETVKIAVRAILSNKIRSFLTMLGVIIGVFSVVTLISLGKGIQNYVEDEFNALGSNMIFVTPGNSGLGGDPAQAFTANKLSDKHVKLIESQVGDMIQAVTPYIIAGDTTTYKTNSYFAEITGVNYRSLEIFSFMLDSGRNFTRAEERNRDRVAIIGPIIRRELFGTRSPVGERISINGESYEVIGTFREKGENYDDLIIVPYTAAEATFNTDSYSSIVANVKNTENIALAIKRVELALMRDLKEDDFTVLSQTDILQEIQGILGILTIGLGAIAGISLLVGGIGIMNIMLVSVTERTSEIGLRKALGATPANISMQFLIESVVLSVTGGLFGILFGLLATEFAQRFVRAEVEFSAVVLAVGFSMIVGALFGTYPAVKAGKKDPIEALRYE